MCNKSIEFLYDLSLIIAAKRSKIESKNIKGGDSVLAFLVCAITGVLQTYLLSVVLKGALNGSMKQAGVALLGKILCYGITFELLWFLFMDKILYCAAGFIVGVIISVIIIAIKNFKNKSAEKSSDGDGVNECSRAD